MRARPPEADVDPREMRENVRVVTSLGYGRCAIVASAPARLERGQVFAKYAEVRDLPTEVFFELGQGRALAREQAGRRVSAPSRGGRARPPSVVDCRVRRL